MIYFYKIILLTQKMKLCLIFMLNTQNNILYSTTTREYNTAYIVKPLVTHTFDEEAWVSPFIPKKNLGPPL